MGVICTFLKMTSCVISWKCVHVCTCFFNYFFLRVCVWPFACAWDRWLLMPDCVRERESSSYSVYLYPLQGCCAHNSAVPAKLRFGPGWAHSRNSWFVLPLVSRHQALSFGLLIWISADSYHIHPFCLRRLTWAHTVSVFCCFISKNLSTPSSLNVNLTWAGAFLRFSLVLV